MTTSSLSIVIDSESNSPKYLQLQQQIESLVKHGRLKTGDKLPSSRELSRSLDISRTSVLRALDNLIAEGVLISRPKSGIYISKFQPSMRTLPTENTDRIVKYSNSLDQNKSAFDSGADTRAFPVKDWAQSMKRAWIKPSQPIMQGLYLDGYPGLKQQIKHYLNELRGLQCDVEQIIVTAGNRDALTILTSSLLVSSESQIFLEQACYPQISSVLKLSNQPIQPLKLDDQGAEIPLYSDVSLNSMAILTPCRQYPTGCPMSSGRRQEWLNLLSLASKNNEKNLFVIEDDYDNEFTYQGRASVPLMQQDQSDSVFFIGSFSKVIFRGLRLGFIVTPKNQSERIKKCQKALGNVGASAMQPALTDFMHSGKFSTHLRRMRRLYTVKRDKLLNCLDQIKNFCRWQYTHAGMHVCLLLKDQNESLEASIFYLASEQGLHLNRLSSHYISDEKQFGFILGFTQQSIEELTLNAGKLCQIIIQVCSEN